MSLNSIGDLAHLIADIMGVKITIKTDEKRLRPESSEVDRLLAGTDKAKAALQWNPAYAGKDGLRRALEETVQWFRNQQLVTNDARVTGADTATLTFTWPNRVRNSVRRSGTMVAAGYGPTPKARSPISRLR